MITFRCYDPSDDGSGGIHKWYRGLSAKFQAEVDGALELLALESSLDGLAEVKPLHGSCEGLTEIKVDFDLDGQEIHIRILGCEGRHKREFILLIGFQKIGHNADYGANCSAAHQRKLGVTRDARRAPFCRFP